MQDIPDNVGHHVGCHNTDLHFWQDLIHLLSLYRHNRLLSPLAAAAAATAAITAQVDHQALHTAVAEIHHCIRITVTLSGTLIPLGTAVLQLGKKLPVYHIIWIHIHCLLNILHGIDLIADTVIGSGPKIIPLGISLGNIMQYIHGFLIHAVVNVIGSRPQLDRPVIILRRLSLLTITVKAAVTVSSLTALAVTSLTIASGSLIFPLLNDLVIGFLDLLEFFLCLLFVRVIDIRVRMIRPAQLSICFFYLIHLGCR